MSIGDDIWDEKAEGVAERVLSGSVPTRVNAEGKGSSWTCG